MSRRRRTYGPHTASFTLVEMLVVVSIVSLLSSLGYAGLSEARAYARDAERLATFHDLRLALEQYYDEYGFYPPNVAKLSPGYNYIVSNPNDYPFEATGVQLYADDIGSSFLPNQGSGVRYMQPLIDAGLWNKTIPNNSTYEAKNWPYRQPNGDIVQTLGADPLSQSEYDSCGGYYLYFNNAGWAGGSSKALGPQVYFLSLQFERRSTFDGFAVGDMDRLQFDSDDDEYSRTAVQYCPRGKALYVFIHHCPGTWEFWKNANNNWGYPEGSPETISLYRCRLNGNIVL
ncbi:MAG: type II secretion system protein [Patescibacteria group bacterium]